MVHVSDTFNVGLCFAAPHIPQPIVLLCSTSSFNKRLATAV